MNEIPVDDIVEGFSDERKMVAFERAERAFGGIVADYDSDEFLQEFADQLTKMVADDMLASLSNKGILEVVGVDDDGEIEYTLTDEAREICQDAT